MLLLLVFKVILFGFCVYTNFSSNIIIHSKNHIVVTYLWRHKVVSLKLNLLYFTLTISKSNTYLAFSPFLHLFFFKPAKLKKGCYMVNVKQNIWKWKIRDSISDGYFFIHVAIWYQQKCHKNFIIYCQTPSDWWQKAKRCLQTLVLHLLVT